MKMMSSTNMMSTKGVTLMPEIIPYEPLSLAAISGTSREQGRVADARGSWGFLGVQVREQHFDRASVCARTD